MVEALRLQGLEYTGQTQPKPGERDPKTGQVLYPYLPSASLIEVVNLAIYLQRPLLLKGEPGCGKTRLAKAVAYELNLPFETWNVKSTSRARDGLYTYDSVGRLRDAQLAANRMLAESEVARISLPETYVKWGPLGRAFRNDQTTVVLIDEIDKADIDFPNDLLLELDERRFTVEEIGQEVQAEHPPIIIITSNDEKDLPDAFLRRCLFHYVEFPNKERLEQIIVSMFPMAQTTIVNKAIGRFWELREDIRKTQGVIQKNVSTSELIDWFNILKQFPEEEALAKLNGTLPFSGVLLKSWEAHQRYMTQTKG